jgi:hypothetical protein
MFPFNRFQKNGHKYGICTKCGFKGLLNYYIGKSSLELDYRKYAEGN